MFSAEFASDAFILLFLGTFAYVSVRSGSTALCCAAFALFIPAAYLVIVMAVCRYFVARGKVAPDFDESLAYIVLRLAACGAAFGSLVQSLPRLLKQFSLRALLLIVSALCVMLAILSMFGPEPATVSLLYAVTAFHPSLPDLRRRVIAGMFAGVFIWTVSLVVAQDPMVLDRLIAIGEERDIFLFGFGLTLFLGAVAGAVYHRVRAKRDRSRAC